MLATYLLEYPNASVCKTIAIAQSTSIVAFIIDRFMFYEGLKNSIGFKKMCRSFCILEFIKYHERVSQNSKNLFVKPFTYDSNVEISITPGKFVFG